MSVTDVERFRAGRLMVSTTLLKFDFHKFFGFSVRTLFLTGLNKLWLAMVTLHSAEELSMFLTPEEVHVESEAVEMKLKTIWCWCYVHLQVSQSYPQGLQESSYSNLAEELFYCGVFPMWSFSLGLFIKEAINVFLHEVLLKVPTPLICSLKPYGLNVPSSLIQNSSLILLYEASRVGFSDFLKDLHSNVIHRMIRLVEVSVE